MFQDTSQGFLESRGLLMANLQEIFLQPGKGTEKKLMDQEENLMGSNPFNWGTRCGLGNRATI